MRPRQGRIIGAVLAAAAVVTVLAARADRARRHPDGRAASAAAPAPAGPSSNELAAQLAAGRAVIDGIAFVGDTDALDRSADAALARLATALVATPGAFLIEAHVAPGGDMLADQSLTDRRAVAVHAGLVARGVPATRLFAMGFGGTRAPVASRPDRIEVSRMPES